jgi:hypothetical protein
MAQKDLDLSFSPQMLEGDSKYLVGAGRLTGKKKLSEDELELYADLMGSLDSRAKGKLSVPEVGGRYKKQLDKNSAVEFYGSKRADTPGVNAGISYERQFKKGGKVRTASQRADGIAIRGKTRA